MLNDDYTPMEFVTMVLEQIFNKSPAEASRVMLSVHRQGSGIAGIYSKEIAETKRDRTIQEARSNGFPLMLHTEPEE
jgi:ATP-dependent Clp protease adaptor protein ClpS